MSRDSTLAVLVTVRSNGAATALASPIGGLCERGDDVTVVCGIDEQARIVAECPAAASAEFVPDAASDRTLLVELLRRISPRVCVRSTPVGGDGPDEWLAGCVQTLDCRPPIVAVQDDIGAGRCLEKATAIATVSSEASALLRRDLRPRAAVIGWTAHDCFAEGPDPSAARAAARAKLHLAPAIRVIVYATRPDGHASDARNINVLAGMRACADGVGHAVVIKAHPRLDAAVAERHRRHVRGLPHITWSDLILPQASWYSVGDCLVADRSSMLRDAVAYQWFWASQPRGTPAATAVLNLAGSRLEGHAIATAAAQAFECDLDLGAMVTAHRAPCPDGRATARLLSLVDHVISRTGRE